MTDNLLIAETDAEGEIVALWHSDGAQRVPHLLNDWETGLELLETAEVSGAEHRQIGQWLTRKQAGRAG
jgi:hypothetical protein